MKKNNYILGLDIGITSVGYGIIDKDTKEIIYAGVRLFEEASTDNNLKRRTFRSIRRLKNRRKQRLIDLKNFLIKENIIRKDTKILDSPYETRIKGLSNRLSEEELLTVLVNISKRRGSSLDIVVEENGKDDESVKGIIQENTKILNIKNLYVCQLQKLREEEGNLRNQNNIFRREDYQKELNKILSNQNLTLQQKEKINEIIFRQRHYSEGPGSYKSPTNYGRFRLKNNQIIEVNLIEIMRGKCSLYKDELRSPKLAPSAELYNFLNDLNNLTIQEENKAPYKLTKDQKLDIINDYILKTGKFTVSNLKKFLNVSDENLFGLREKNNKPILTEFKGYLKFLKELKNNYDFKLLDIFSEILTSNKTPSERKEKLSRLNIDIDKEDIEILSNLPGFTNYHSLSLKAIYEINEELIETSYNSMQIITNNTLNTSVSLKGYVNIPFNDEEVLNPVVKRAQRETIKVVNALRKEFGEFDSIIIELARDKNSDEERRSIKELNDINLKNKEFIDELLISQNKKPDDVNIHTKLKLRLYVEQNGKCAYSGNKIDINDLISDPTAYEIDHIIPYSISFDDSLNNKVLVEQKVNQYKTNLTPFGYFSKGFNYGEIKTFEKFTSLVLNNKSLKKKKVNYLLFQEDITKFDTIKKFLARNLNDTRYTSRQILNLLQKYFKDNEIDTKVSVIRGSITNTFRKKAKINKDRDNYMHHAIDALIIAGLNSKKLISNLLIKCQNKYDDETGELIESSNENLLEDAELNKLMRNIGAVNCESIKFSWKQDKKINRTFSDQTIYKAKKINDELRVVKSYKDIYGKEGESLAKLFKKNKSECLLMFKNDYESYLKLKKIYENYINETNPFKTYFSEHGFIRKKAKDNNGPIIKKVRYLEDRLGNFLDISTNYNLKNDDKVVLLQLTPYRIDVYKNNKGEYKFLTIRRYNIKMHNNKFVINKDEYLILKENKKIDDSFIFEFSFYRNNIIRLVKEDKEGLVTNLYRFIGTNNDINNIIEVKNIDKRTEKQNMLSIGKKIKLIEKYNVSILGKYYKVEKEDLKLEF